MPPNNFWTDLPKKAIDVAITVIVTVLITSLIAYSSGFWKQITTQNGVDCVTERKIQNSNGSIQVPCDIGYSVTGGGIRSILPDDISKNLSSTIFEESYPVEENVWQCDIGAGKGHFECYARCCKSKTK